MKVSLNLLKQFVKIPYSPERLAELITERTFEVEGWERVGAPFAGVYSARVVAIKPHPDADRLRLVTLDMGRGLVEPVVCGAHNFQEGDVVPLAIPGANLPLPDKAGKAGSIVLKRAIIRGVESQGMICAASELGVGPDDAPHTILVLNKTTPIGQDLAEQFAADTVLHVALPANRPDLFSHWGIAREMVAVLHLTPKVYEPKPLKLTSNKYALLGPNKVKKLVPKFWAIRLSGVVIKPAPEFIQATLKNLGVRPINNVVDITNYVMAEMGQPLHAFSATGIQGRMQVRLAKPGEKITVINHRQYELATTDLVIADEVKPLDIAGIMGGLETEIADDTHEIILTAANFNAEAVRKTSRRLGLRTEGSGLWEKGLHPNLADIGAARAVDLLRQYADATVETVELQNFYQEKPAVIKFKPEDINRLLGTQLNAAAIKKGLHGFGVAVKGTLQLSAMPSWWRPDLQKPADLAEEILKVHGINNIKPAVLLTQARADIDSDQWRQPRAIRISWASLGYNEVQNYSFVSETDVIKFGADPKEYISIANPLSADQGYLRRHLLIPLLKNISINQKRFEDFRLFEIGKQYLAYGHEPLLLSGVLYSKTMPIQRLVNQAKGDCVQFLQSLGFPNPTFSPVDDLWLEIKIYDQAVGLVGIVQKNITDNFQVDQEVAWLKFELDKLLALSPGVNYSSVSKYPAAMRDLSLVMPLDMPWRKIDKLIRQTSGLIQNISVIEADFLTTSAMPFHQTLRSQGKKNLVARLHFQSAERTLTDQEISGILAEIMLQLKQLPGIEIR